MGHTLYQLALFTCALSTVAAQSQGTIFLTTNPGTAGAPPTSTVAGSTGVAEFAVGSSIYEVTAISSNKVVLAGYTLSPGGLPALVGGAIVSAASDGFVAGSSTIPYSSGNSGEASILTPSSTSYTDGETSVASVMSNSDGSSSDATSTTGSSPGAAPAFATGSWQSAAVALGGLAGVAAFL